MFPIIDKLGGWDAVRAWLEARGEPVSDQRKSNWRRRGIPAAIQNRLREMADELGVRPEPIDFLAADRVRTAS